MESKQMESFTSALESGDLKRIGQFPKSDLHSHAGRGGNAKYIAQWAKQEIPLPPAKFKSLSDMQLWYNDHIRKLASGLDGQIKRWEAAFHQANEDHIEVLALSFSASEIQLVGGIEKFALIVKQLHQDYAPDTKFLPELTYDRGCDVSKEVDGMDEILQAHFFCSLDICGDEFAQPIQNMKPLYRKAKEHGLRLKAHVGEFGSADDVMEAVEELELNEVHHGIAAAESSFVMQWLADHKIRLNICPTSNVMLQVVRDYKSHPIQKLCRSGVLVTINTDDLLIFNQTVSQEYRNLYQAGTLSAKELEQIRQIGLSQKELVCNN